MFYRFYTSSKCVENFDPLMFTCTRDQYRTISLFTVYDADVFELVAVCNVIVILDKWYQLGIHRRHFGHNKSGFNSIYRHKNTPDTRKHIVYIQIGGNDFIRGNFDYSFSIRKCIQLYSCIMMVCV